LLPQKYKEQLHKQYLVEHHMPIPTPGAAVIKGKGGNILSAYRRKRGE